MWEYDNSYEELYHHGVKGMKWGVRRNRKSSVSAAKKKAGASSKKDSGSKNASSIRKKGEAFVKTITSRKVRSVVASTAAVASGALWVASALVPGAPILNTIAAVANVTSLGLADKG